MITLQAEIASSRQQRKTILYSSRPRRGPADHAMLEADARVQYLLTKPFWMRLPPTDCCPTQAIIWEIFNGEPFDPHSAMIRGLRRKKSREERPSRVIAVFSGAEAPGAANNATPRVQHKLRLLYARSGAMRDNVFQNGTTNEHSWRIKSSQKNKQKITKTPKTDKITWKLVNGTSEPPTTQAVDAILLPKHWRANACNVPVDPR